MGVYFTKKISIEKYSKLHKFCGFVAINHQNFKKIKRSIGQSGALCHRISEISALPFLKGKLIYPVQSKMKILFAFQFR